MSRRAPGTLYLIPTPLGEQTGSDGVAPDVLRVVASLNHFVVEAAKTARQHLRRYGHPAPIQSLHIVELNEHTPATALPELLQPLLDGVSIGLMSEAGCPAVADPGSALVALAHDRNIPVVPLVGPSSLLLALMASGMQGQRFAFHGYLPLEAPARLHKIRELEQRARQEDATQLFIETPYRNNALLELLLQTCQRDTRLAVACNLTQADALLVSRRVRDWPEERPNLHKRPTVFLLHGGRA